MRHRRMQFDMVTQAFKTAVAIRSNTALVEYDAANRFLACRGVLPWTIGRVSVAQTIEMSVLGSTTECRKIPRIAIFVGEAETIEMSFSSSPRRKIPRTAIFVGVPQTIETTCVHGWSNIQVTSSDIIIIINVTKVGGDQVSDASRPRNQKVTKVTKVTTMSPPFGDMVLA